MKSPPGTLNDPAEIPDLAAAIAETKVAADTAGSKAISAGSTAERAHLAGQWEALTMRFWARKERRLRREERRLRKRQFQLREELLLYPMASGLSAFAGPLTNISSQ